MDGRACRTETRLERRALGLGSGLTGFLSESGVPGERVCCFFFSEPSSESSSGTDWSEFEFRGDSFFGVPARSALLARFGLIRFEFRLALNGIAAQTYVFKVT